MMLRALLFLFCFAGIAAGQTRPTGNEGLRGFVYIEPFEIRLECVIPLIEVTGLLDLDPNTELAASDQEKVLSDLRNRVKSAGQINADGVPLQFAIDRVQFATVDLKKGITPDKREMIPVETALVAAVLVTPREAPPSKIEVSWDLFSDDRTSVPVEIEATSGTSMEFFNHNLQFAAGDGPKSWVLPVIGAIPQLIKVTTPSRRSSLSFLIATFVLVISAFFLARTGRRRLRTTAFALFAGAVLLLAGGLFRHSRTSLTEKEAQPVVDHLLHNVYHSFAYRDESRIFDTLATSVAGNLLEELYLEIRGGLELENEGGPRVKVHNVRLEECHLDTSSAAPGFRAEARWVASGNVSHWGHIHPRRNRYHCNLTIEPVEGRWKITAIQVLEEERM